MDRIGDHFGFDDDAFAGDDVSGGEAAKEEEVKEEKTVFDLKLEGFDAKAKIKVIKEIRAVTGLGLKEAKELVEGAPVSTPGCVGI
jgi:large subunit ribosomal protein L7/L12